jgi:hypothetical protein
MTRLNLSPPMRSKTSPTSFIWADHDLSPSPHEISTIVSILSLKFSRYHRPVPTLEPEFTCPHRSRGRARPFLKKLEDCWEVVLTFQAVHQFRPQTLPAIANEFPWELLCKCAIQCSIVWDIYLLFHTRSLIVLFGCVLVYLFGKSLSKPEDWTADLDWAYTVVYCRPGRPRGIRRGT